MQKNYKKTNSYKIVLLAQDYKNIVENLTKRKANNYVVRFFRRQSRFDAEILKSQELKQQQSIKTKITIYL